MKPEVRATNLLHQSAPEFLIKVIAVFGWSCSESIFTVSRTANFLSVIQLHKCNPTVWCIRKSTIGTHDCHTSLWIPKWFSIFPHDYFLYYFYHLHIIFLSTFFKKSVLWKLILILIFFSLNKWKGFTSDLLL